MTPTEVTTLLRQFNGWRRDTSNWPPSPMLIEKAIDAAIEMIERLETAENDAAHQKALAASALRVAEGWEGKCNSLRAKIEAMERQAPAMWVNSSNIVSARINRERGGIGDQHTCTETKTAYHDAPLYALPGAQAQPAPTEQDTSVRKAWARFSNELHRSPDAPYPGMSEAFEQHFSQSFTDREWRAESGVWAAAWKAAKNHGAQAQPASSVPDEIERDVLRACCGTFHGSRHRITCEKYKGKREPGDKP